MNITAKETFVAELNTALQNEIKTLVEKTEATIAKARSLPVTVYTNDFSSLACERVCEQYRAAGWQVEAEEVTQYNDYDTYFKLS